MSTHVCMYTDRQDACDAVLLLLSLDYVGGDLTEIPVHACTDKESDIYFSSRTHIRTSVLTDTYLG